MERCLHAYAPRIALPEYVPQGMMFAMRHEVTGGRERWVPDVVHALGSADLEAAVDHLLNEGRLGGLV